MTLLHRKCENCNTIIEIYRSDITRGKGIFCCPKCAAPTRKIPKISKFCLNCNNHFKTMSTNKLFCSIECEENYNNSDI